MSIQWITVYDPSSSCVSEAIVLNPEQLHTLATWLCASACRCESPKRGDEIQANEGYCDACRDTAGFLLTQCPYIDMAKECA